MPTKPRLTDRMRLFCEARAKGGTNVAAARAAGCKGSEASASVQAARWLALPAVQDYLADLGKHGRELLAERQIRVEEEAQPEGAPSRVVRKAMELADIIEGLSDEAHADMGDYLSFYPTLDDQGQPVMKDGKPAGFVSFDLERAVREGKTHLIKELKMGKFGWEIKLVDRQAAKVALAKIRGLIDPEEGQGATEALRVWAEVLAKALRQPHVTPRDLYLAHMARRPIDIEARLVGPAAGSNGGGNGNGH